MSSVSPKIGRLTNEIHLESIKIALSAGFRAGADDQTLEEFLSGTSLWSMDPREDKTVKTKAPKKPSPAKDSGERPKKKESFPVNEPDLADKAFDPEFCNARL